MLKKDWYSTADVALILSKTTAEVGYLIASKTLPAKNIGKGEKRRCWRVARINVVAYCHENMIPCTDIEDRPPTPNQDRLELEAQAASTPAPVEARADGNGQPAHFMLEIKREISADLNLSIDQIWRQILEKGPQPDDKITTTFGSLPLA